MRADLLALTRAALEDLANRGLVKRAMREVEGGSGPAITEADDGTVTGIADDITTVLAPGVGLADTECNCGASGICRHRLAVVLGYQATHTAATDQTDVDPDAIEAGDSATSSDETATQPPDGDLVLWSPGSFTDDQLIEVFGKNAISAARRYRTAGRIATVIRPSPADAVPAVELDTSTVRFLVPHDLNYVSTSARAGDAGPFVVLAVWAFRQADETAPDEGRVTLDIGKNAEDRPDLSSLAVATEFAQRLLIDGIASTGNYDLAAEPARRGLDDARFRWPLAAFEDLLEQIDEYANRGARYSPRSASAFIAELHARHRAAHNGSDVPRSRILGTAEAAEASMRHLRLDGLGCRISGRLEDRQTDIFFAHADAATVYVIRRRDRYPDADQAPSPDSYLRRVGAAKATIGSLSHGNIITSSANRRANREVRIARSTVAQTSVVPSGAAWEKLPEPLRVDDLAKLAKTIADRPPQIMRARVLAESMHAVAIAEVVHIGYRPGAQQLHAVVIDPAGNEASVYLEHRSVAPGALDALYGALASPDLRFLSGFVHIGSSQIVIDPIGAGTDHLIAFDATVEADTMLPTGSRTRPESPLAAAISAALEVLADGCHRGLRNVAPSYAGRARQSAARLGELGLRSSGEHVDAFADAFDRFRSDGQTQDLATTWVDAQIRLMLAAELSVA